MSADSPAEVMSNMAIKPPVVLEQLSEPDKKQRAILLKKLHDEPASSQLLAYFERLKEGSATWDVDTYIEGMKRLANLVGPERVIYYDEPLKGLHYPDTFAELWNKANPQQPITVYDRDIRYQCPPSWSNGLKDNHQVLTYEGEAPLGHGLNELLKGPTTIDCGMWVALLLWMGIRYLIGDDLFHAIFKFEKGGFIITQNWDEPINKAGTVGNLLYPFYDSPSLHKIAYFWESQTRIQIKTIHNHESYLAKHLGGLRRLENVVQVDDDYIIFDPGAPQAILSRSGLEEKLMKAYNAPQSFADAERTWMYTTFPTYVHPDFAPKNWGSLAEEAKKYANHTLNEIEWEGSKSDRENQDYHLVFNFQRLIDSLGEARHGSFSGAVNGDVLSRAKSLKLAAALDGLLLQLRLSP
ncbi:hypothetical protein ASPNIDRAFT_53663 [Aspergillus niger ATCC 1015]|uniref:Uncharacterized protein n=3 Tax=Aspergillus niger TaxID=5061 RepID=G3Y5G2_ASPNA|nr:hypothetical protein ASPNIDRAFT_53663 [Aspergillus niger ATCC 1015]KAI2989176.1 hypothetical protein CBS147345_10643 [Aspergillus niger]SPB49751.1 unnamed protein product [Aspergillus niger]